MRRLKRVHLVNSTKNRYRMNHEAMSAISVFQVNLQSNSLVVRKLIFLNSVSFKRKHANSQQANGKGKEPFKIDLLKARE